MPHLQCPRCDGTTWLRGDPERQPVCEHCGSALTPLPRRLAAALRERSARDARLSADRPRFVRDRR
jgi:hypothetical protein